MKYNVYLFLYVAQMIYVDDDVLTMIMMMMYDVDVDDDVQVIQQLSKIHPASPPPKRSIVEASNVAENKLRALLKSGIDLNKLYSQYDVNRTGKMMKCCSCLQKSEQKNDDGDDDAQDDYDVEVLMIMTILMTILRRRRMIK